MVAVKTPTTMEAFMIPLVVGRSLSLVVAPPDVTLSAVVGCFRSCPSDNGKWWDFSRLDVLYDETWDFFAGRWKDDDTFCPPSKRSIKNPIDLIVICFQRITVEAKLLYWLLIFLMIQSYGTTANTTFNNMASEHCRQRICKIAKVSDIQNWVIDNSHIIGPNRKFWHQSSWRSLWHTFRDFLWTTEKNKPYS